MKNVKLLFVVLAVCLLCACNSRPMDLQKISDSLLDTASDIQPYCPVSFDEVNERHGDLAYRTESLEDLEQRTEVIIKGVLQDDGRELVDFDEWGNKLNGYTLHSLLINEVYKGNLDEGETITLAEEYFLDSFEGKTYLTIYDKNRPCKIGKEYIFFLRPILKDNPDINDAYLPVGMEKGRFPILPKTRSTEADIDSLTNEDVDLGQGDISNYKEIFKEVTEKYLS